MHKEIKKIEEEVQERYIENQGKFNIFFWKYHVKIVIELSKKMAKKYKADLETVWLGAILHDVAKIKGEKSHEEAGAQESQEILSAKGFSGDVIEKVKNIILTHRCKKYCPESLEEKIVASADAMAHFKSPFHFWYFKFSEDEFEEIMESGRIKIERDFKEKIFFDEEREEVRKEYEVLKKMFNDENNA